MRKFDTDERRAINSFCWVAGVCFIAMLLVSCFGCSSTGIARQIRELPNEKATLDTIKGIAVENCNNGIWTPEQCDRVMRMITQTGNTYNLYVRNLNAYVNGTTTEQGVMMALNNFTANMTELISILEGLGIKVRKK